MIITELNGGLGNQMFQYAVGRRMAIENNTILKLDTSIFDTYKLRKYELCHFNIAEKILCKNEMIDIAAQEKYKNILRYIRSLLKNDRFKIVEEKQFHFDQRLLSLRGNLVFRGYWQTEKYFKDIEDVIRKDFTLARPLSQASKDVADLIATQSCPVSLHIRRGDYISNPLTNQYHGTCSLEYYQECIAKLEQVKRDISLFVFSDDPLWVKKNLNLKKPMFFISHNGENQAYEDMHLMSLCHHHVIANSSFSWWGAWLNSKKDKLVFSPKHWFASGEHDTKDLVPKSWYKV